MAKKFNLLKVKSQKESFSHCNQLFNVCADNDSFQEKIVKTTSDPKHKNVFWIEEFLKTNNMENCSDNPKEEDSKNSKKKLKDISNTDKETYELTLNNNLQ